MRDIISQSFKIEKKIKEISHIINFNETIVTYFLAMNSKIYIP